MAKYTQQRANSNSLRGKLRPKLNWLQSSAFGCLITTQNANQKHTTLSRKHVLLQGRAGTKIHKGTHIKSTKVNRFHLGFVLLLDICKERASNHCHQLVFKGSRLLTSNLLKSFGPFLQGWHPSARYMSANTTRFFAVLFIWGHTNATMAGRWKENQDLRRLLFQRRLQRIL